MEILSPRVHFVSGSVSWVELMEDEPISEQLAELHPPNGVPAPIKSGRVDTHSQYVGDHYNQRS